LLGGEKWEGGEGDGSKKKKIARFKGELKNSKAFMFPLISRPQQQGRGEKLKKTTKPRKFILTSEDDPKYRGKGRTSSLCNWRPFLSRPEKKTKKRPRGLGKPNQEIFGNSGQLTGQKL